jgi:hypothetical protein
MELRIYADAEIRKGGCMSKTPDLSAFPIPRKGGARPIEIDETPEPAAPPASREGEGVNMPTPVLAAVPAGAAAPPEPKKTQMPQRPVVEQAPASAPYGQTVATTVKLDENRYLRLAEAGRPEPGRLKRRTIQEMFIEALDEWFEKRGL